jgi:lipid-A-disaccharide synthase
MNAEPGSTGPGPLIMISAAEPSADLHGAALMRAVQDLDPTVRFVGVAGPEMRHAGCHTVYDMARQAAMAGVAFRRVPQGLAMLRRCRACLKRFQFDLAIVIDAPILNLPLSKHARRAGVPVLYYIAPQLWAWGEGRIRRIRARVARMAVILPFEEEYFRRCGVDATYVGHPMFDKLTARRIDQERIKGIQGQGQPVICILPGSREHVVTEVLPGQLEVASAIARRYPQTHVCVSVANQRVNAAVRALAAQSSLRHSIHTGENGEILTASDLALVASGTATLETAYYHTPMIVMYNASRLGYHLLARWVLKAKLLSLINILAGRELVPEFMPFYKSTAPIIAKALQLLESPESLAAMRSELAATVDPLVMTGAAQNTAAIVMEMLRQRRNDRAE